MPAFSLKISGSESAVKRLSLLAAKAKNLRPAQRAIGEYMLLQSRTRFDLSQAPSGAAWKPLAEATIRAKERSKNRKQRRGAKKLYKRTRANPSDILKDTFTLRDTITYQIEGAELAIGSSLKYAKYHQLGTGRAPKREFLGVNQADRQEIKRIVADHLAGN
jgi:phage virion morphogenesis protein